MAKQCKFTNKCFDENCYNLHSVNFCKQKDHCVDFHCRKRHSKRRAKPCAAGGDCKTKDTNCRYLHPIPYETVLHLEKKIKRDKLQELSKKYKVHYQLVEKKNELKISSNRGQTAVEAFLDEINVTKFTKKISVPEIMEPFSTNSFLQDWLNTRIEYKFGKVNLVWKSAKLEIFAARVEKIEKVINYLNKLKQYPVEYHVNLTREIILQLKEELNNNFVVHIPPEAFANDVHSELSEVREVEDDLASPVNVDPDLKKSKNIIVYSFANFAREESRKYLFQLRLILKENYIDIRSEFIGYIKLNNKKLFGKDKILTYNSATKDKLSVSHFCTKETKDIIEWVRSIEKDLSILKINFPEHTAEEIAKLNEAAREKLPTCYWVKDETKITAVFKRDELDTIIDCILSVSTTSKKKIDIKLPYLRFLIKYKRFPPELDFCNKIIGRELEEISVTKCNVLVNETGLTIYGSDELIEIAADQIEKAFVAFDSLSSNETREYLPEEMKKYNILPYIKRLASTYGVHTSQKEVVDGRIKHEVLIQGLSIMVSKAMADLDKLLKSEPPEDFLSTEKRAEPFRIPKEDIDA